MAGPHSYEALKKKHKSIYHNRTCVSLYSKAQSKDFIVIYMPNKVWKNS